MTTAKWVRDLLQSDWGEGSNNPPAEPNITVEGDAKERSVHQRDNDIIFVEDGGRPVVQPQSINYREERIESIIDIQIISAEGRERLLGEPDNTYGGLEGEVKRIIDKHRKGYPSDGAIRDPGYDIIQPDTFDDQIGNRGAGLWAGTWTITFITYAAQIGETAVIR